MKYLYLILYITVSTICYSQGSDTNKVSNFADIRRARQWGDTNNYHLRNISKDTVHIIRYVKEGIKEIGFYTKSDTNWQMYSENKIIRAGNFEKIYGRLFSKWTILYFFNLRRVPMVKVGWWIEYDEKGDIEKKILYEKGTILEEDLPHMPRE